MPVEGAQMLGPLERACSLFAGVDPDAARDAEIGWAASSPARRPAGARDVAARTGAQRRSCSRRSSRRRTTTGSSSRVLNPTDAPLEAQLTLGLPFASVESVRLDETPDGDSCARDGGSLRCGVPGPRTPVAAYPTRLDSRPAADQ
jgi:hypothetical protein